MLITYFILNIFFQQTFLITQYKPDVLTKNNYDSFYIPTDNRNNSKQTIVLNTKKLNLNTMPLQYTHISPTKPTKLNIVLNDEIKKEEKIDGIIIKNMPPKNQLLTSETLKQKLSQIKKEKSVQEEIIKEEIKEKIEEKKEIEVVKEEVKKEEIKKDEKPVEKIDTNSKIDQLKGLIQGIENEQIKNTQDPFDPRNPIDIKDVKQIQFVQQQEIKPPDNNQLEQQQPQQDFFNRNISDNNDDGGVMLFDQIINEQLKKQQENFVDSFDDVITYDSMQNNEQNQNDFSNNNQERFNNNNFQNDEFDFVINSPSQQNNNNNQPITDNPYNIVFVNQDDSQTQQTNYDIQFVQDPNDNQSQLQNTNIQQNQFQSQNENNQQNQFQPSLEPNSQQNIIPQIQQNPQQINRQPTPQLQPIQRFSNNLQPIQRSDSNLQPIQRSNNVQPNIKPQVSNMQVTPKIQRGPQALAILDTIKDPRLQPPKPLIRRDSQNVQLPSQQTKTIIKKLFLQQNDGSLTPFFVIDNENKYQEGNIYSQTSLNTQQNNIQQQTRPQIKSQQNIQQQGFQQIQDQLNDPLIYSSTRQPQMIDQTQQQIQQPLIRQESQQYIQQSQRIQQQKQNINLQNQQQIIFGEQDVPNQITDQNIANEMDEIIKENLDVPNQMEDEIEIAEDPTSGFFETNDFSNIKKEDKNQIQNQQEQQQDLTDIQQQQNEQFEIENKVLEDQLLQFEANLKKQQLRIQGIQMTNDQLDKQTQRLKQMQVGLTQEEDLNKEQKVYDVKEVQKNQQKEFKQFF